MDERPSGALGYNLLYLNYQSGELHRESAAWRRASDPQACRQPPDSASRALLKHSFFGPTSQRFPIWGALPDALVDPCQACVYVHRSPRPTAFQQPFYASSTAVLQPLR